MPHWLDLVTSELNCINLEKKSALIEEGDFEDDDEEEGDNNTSKNDGGSFVSAS